MDYFLNSSSRIYIAAVSPDGASNARMVLFNYFIDTDIHFGGLRS